MIRNRRDLRNAYSSILFYEELLDSSQWRKDKDLKEIQVKEKALRDCINERKKDIRAYNKIPVVSKMIASDIDGYLLLTRLPELIKSKKSAQDFFEENMRLECAPSQFDCTGQSFTITYRTQKRSDGRYYIFHSVGYDV